MDPRARFQKRSATSRAGAAHAQPSMGMKATAVLGVIVRKGGASIAEIAHELGCGSNAVTSSIAALRDDFRFIEDSGARRATVTPCRGVVWTATQAGKDALNGRADVLKVHANNVATPTETVPQLSLEFSHK